MEMTDTGLATRPLVVLPTTSCTSSSVKVAAPGAKGIRVMPLSVWTQSPESLNRWLSACSRARPPDPAASARTARWFANVPVGMKTARSFPRSVANRSSNRSTVPPIE